MVVRIFREKVVIGALSQPETENFPFSKQFTISTFWLQLLDLRLKGRCYCHNFLMSNYCKVFYSPSFVSFWGACVWCGSQIKNVVYNKNCFPMEFLTFSPCSKQWFFARKSEMIFRLCGKSPFFHWSKLLFRYIQLISYFFWRIFRCICGQRCPEISEKSQLRKLFWELCEALLWSCVTLAQTSVIRGLYGLFFLLRWQLSKTRYAWLEPGTFYFFHQLSCLRSRSSSFANRAN